jgi:hypothetical protein
MNPTLETMQHAQEIIDYLAENPEQHSQSAYWNGYSLGIKNTVCGTTMCVAGTSVFLKEGVDGLVNSCDSEDYDDSFSKKAERYLGLNSSEAYDLFYTFHREKALEMLRAVANGDEVKFEAIHDSYIAGVE